MKILFVANRVPYPPYRGDKLKIFNLARRLCKTNKLYLITFAETKNDLSYKKELEAIFTKVIIIYLPKWKSYLNSFFAVFGNNPLQVAYFASSKMNNTIKNFVAKNKIDIIHTQHLRMAQFTKDIEIPKILDLPDAFSLYWKRRIDNSKNIIIKTIQKIEFKRLFEYEKNIINFFNLSLVCSVEDLDYLKSEHKSKNVNLLRNGVDLETFSSQKHDYSISDIILFTGNMDYSPNVDAVLYFSQEIFPIILNENQNAKFIIAGQKPIKQVRKLKSDNIEVTGFVEKLSDYYNKASVVVSPLRFGAGTQNKVLEAMAMGIPVVCSNIGYAGLEVQNGEGVFLEENAENFALKVVELLNSKEKREVCGKKGIEIAKNKFSWDTIAVQLQNYLSEQLH